MIRKEISIVIATYNSEGTLSMVLDSIVGQSFSPRKMEILIVDGGSTDDTLKIIKKYNCKIINNPKTEPVYAKFLGYLNAKGRYIVYLDHDEVIENPKCLEIKHSIFLKHKDVKAVIGSGYKNPRGYPFINNYINEFGDPFSAYIYGLSKDARFFEKQMIARYGNVEENKHYTVFNLGSVRRMPIIELCAAGSMFDGKYMKDNFPDTLKKPSLIPHFFYLMNSKSSLIAITKNDALVHYSSDTLSKYLNKIRWRIKNNIYHKSDMGESGFTGREKYSSIIVQYKKYLFLPYVYTVIFCLLDSIKLSVTRKNIYYLIHLPLCIFTANLILYHLFIKLFGNSPKLKSYDEKKIAGSVSSR
jgi:glycosyltransferase involved in cell wall biosynthesis